ncbi:BadF/BadG/BcrA/BcrD ATPase family protein [Streptomyces asoensis]|uniref:BadF/BadG/BcrA/BcrD ATPase family protein n=1 Tax=Streptomyces asoensis TaxID=249586 RepID=UPI003717BA60
MGSHPVTSVLVGIDSGGSRTNVEITVDDRTDVVDSYERSDSLSGVLSPSEYPRVMRSILAPLQNLYRKHGFPATTPTHIFISSAAYTQWVKDDIMSAILATARDMNLGRLEMVGICNDCVALVYGLDVDGMVIAGTGSDILFRSRGDRPVLRQVGGDDWVVSDQGSAFWIAMHALRVAYKDLRADNDSVLVQRLREHFGLRRVMPSQLDALYGKLRELSFADSDMKKEIARFARQVCNAAERGDEAARGIVLSEARELADSTMECIRKTYERLPAELTIAQCGGVFRNEFYRTSFDQQFDGHLRYNAEYTTSVNWLRVPTATSAALNLARIIRNDPEPLLSIDAAFRPLLVPIGRSAPATPVA